MNEGALGMLQSLLGPDGVITDPEDLAYYATDISGEGEVLPLCVIRPIAVDQLCQAVTIANGLGLPLVPRGGGMSYTQGYLPEQPNSVMVDLGALNQIEDINEGDMYVTVQAGCTWATLYDALKERGLRTPYFGPLSGMSSTVGGAASNNSTFFGSGTHGAMSESVLGLDVVMADGSLLETGASAADGRNPFLRSFGPDLSGLFLGDCGAFGIKARVTLRLIALPAVEDYLSYAFERIEDIALAHVALAKENIVAEQWGIDPVGNQHLAAKGFDFLEGLGFVKDVAAASAGVLQTLRSVGKLAIEGHRAVDRSGYALHAVVEGQDDKEVDWKADRVRRILGPMAQRELPNTIPQVTRAKPFRPIKALLGPEGENWLPVHGLFPLSRAEEVSAVTDEYFSRHHELMAKHNITFSYLTGASSTSFLIEPMFYWKDRLHPFHMRHITEVQKAKYGKTPADEETREQVMKLRRDLAGLWDAFGASHHQMGRHYAYASQLSSAARASVIAVKAALDPRGIMNPGVLELTGDGDGLKKMTKFPEFPQDLLRDMRNVI
ncbi:MAG: FAD-binding oxidoreductase [Rhodospirillaceae bacterium]|nr:FAD-binding oxidoreductase [Rhodospirillaceae bacterium]